MGELLPLERELFGLAVVDEATQCDTASLLPVLYRARRAAVTGDPKQLRHVSFLSEARLAQIAERHGIDSQTLDDLHFRARSALDVVNAAIGSQQHVALLDEHFRSQPQLIDFSNREFYDGRLKVLTQRPETVRRRCLERYRTLRRAGLRMLPLPLAAWRRDRQASLAEVESWLAG